MKLHQSSILIYTIFNLFHGITALPAPVGLNIAAGFLSASFVSSALDPRLRQDLNAVQVPNKEICGGRGRCTSGATCIDEVCTCSPGWIPDPLILPVFDAGWRSCVQQNECLALEMACNDANAACVDRDPPERFDCVCPSDFTTLPLGSTDPSIECVSSDDSAYPTTTPSSVAPAPEDTPAPENTPSPNEKPSPEDLSCTRKCNSPKEFCLKNDRTKGADWPKCTCNQHFQRNANGDSCGMIYYCDSEASAQKSCPSPGTNCIQHGGGGGYFCMCMDGYIGGPNSEEGCVLTPAPTTSTPSLVPSVSLAPSIAPTTAPPTLAPTPPLSFCAALFCPKVRKDFKILANLKNAVEDDQLEHSIDLHGAPNCWDVSQITDMSNLFESSNFNDDISCWDVSSVTDMNDMFRSNISFNKPLNDWDVSSVTDMSNMFRSNVFNQELNAWDVSRVMNMQALFRSNEAFNQDLKDWDVSKVTDMSFMFYSSKAFNQNLCSWGPKITLISVAVTNMFKYATKCANQVDPPNLSGIPPGPFCSTCEN